MYFKFQKQYSNVYLLFWLNDLILIRCIWEKCEQKIIVVTILTKFLNMCEKRNKPIFRTLAFLKSFSFLKFMAFSSLFPLFTLLVTFSLASPSTRHNCLDCSIIRAFLPLATCFRLTNFTAFLSFHELLSIPTREISLKALLRDHIRGHKAN